MKQNFFLPLSFVCLWGMLLGANSALAQEITADDTTNTTVNRDGNNFTISDGDRAGSNLFHSFRDFSVPNGGSAFFDNADVIENIFSRVTGGNISNINGLIRANNASLFLINPAGIMFGRDARLDIGGSFLGSTADSILFPDDVAFSANDLQPPILTINAPIGLGFRDNPAPIENNSTASADLDPSVTFDDNLFGLRVRDGKSFALAGGDITADGGGIVSVGGRIELGAIGEEGTVGLDFDGNTLSLNIPDNILRADVSLTNEASFLVAGSGGGDIEITARNIDLSGVSSLTAGILADLGLPDAQAGDIRLNTTDNIAIDNSFVFNQVLDNATGNGGDLFIDTRNLSITNGGRAGVLTFGTGNTGNVIINASESIQLDSTETGFFTGIFAQILQQGWGNVGNTSIETKNLSISNNARIGTNTFGRGNAGTLDIQTQVLNISEGAQITSSTIGQGHAGDLSIITDALEINGGENGIFTALSSSVSSEAEGKAGNITIGSEQLPIEQLTVTNGAQILAATFGQGDGGNITIHASELVKLDGGDAGFLSGLFAEVGQTGKGNGGSVNIKTGNLSINNGGRISTSIFGEGQGGNITIDSKNLTVQNRSQIQAILFGKGQGGDLTINASESVEIKKGASLFADTRGFGNAGELTITTRKLLVEEGLVGTGTFGDGQGGTLTVNSSESVELIGTQAEGNPGGLNSQTQSIRNANNLTVNTKLLIVQDGASIAVPTLDSGTAGDLNITTEQLIIEDAQISASTFSSGDAGNLNVVASESIELIGTDEGLGENPSGIFAQANRGSSGNGGNLTVETKRLSAIDGGQVSATNLGTGNAGDLSIIASESVELVGTSTNGEVTSGIFVDTDIAGNAGDLNVKTEQLIVRDSAEISANSKGEGSGGKLFLEANSLTLDGQASISGSTESGEGGNITLKIADNLTLRDNSTITAQAFEAADGGNINIDAEFIIAFPSQNNDIIASAQEGMGGRITIDTKGIFGIQERPQNERTNDIDATGGVDGEVIINTPDVDITQELIESPRNVVEPEQTTAQACRSDRITGKVSGLIIKGKGGIPSEPTAPMDNDAILVDGKIINLQPQVQSLDIKPIKTSIGDIYPARGIMVSESGEVILTAYPTDGIDRRTPQIQANCTHS